MHVLLIGAGGVGEAIVNILSSRKSKNDWLKKMILADSHEDRVCRIAEKIGEPRRFIPAVIDASQKDQIKHIIRYYGVDLVLNASPPYLNRSIFEAAYEAETHYLDLGAYSLAHPTEPLTTGYEEWIGEYYFNQSQAWADKKRLAVLGAGMDPGTADVFARYAEKHLFDELEEISVKDGNNITLKDLDFAFGFNVWTLIDEVLNPPIFWEKDRGWYTGEPFSGEEEFDFPDGIGPQKVISVEHEEVIFIPRYINKGLRKVDFKIALGDELINALKVLRSMGLDSTSPIEVNGMHIAPRDLVAACVTQPADLGEQMEGKVCVGLHVKGVKDGKKREVFIHQTTDHRESMDRYGCQAVVSQTALGACITLELLAKGIWTGNGVHSLEYFNPDAFIELMPSYQYAFGIKELDPLINEGDQ
ncbi:MAG: saccharopine dehydrogenase NADP-binding domain-containing protein [Bacillota bacterium]|nr:saccharopine dehydrogenase NADP-binding domain-containing protein [Bacillota bacterium]MDW7677031.1 saccharopine dehydrogenase NADP-binding domain-containing protein [Bacillota bacterium]